MGDRVSIQFQKDEVLSPVLFSHWDGMGFVQEARQYVRDLKEAIKKAASVGTYPLDRLEPETVFVDFIRHLTHKMKRVESNYYAGCSENDGDNSDNGHHVIKL